MRELKVFKNELHFNNIIFDDYAIFEDRHYWSQICQSCVNKLDISANMLDKDAGHGICGVKGCSNESNHYIDF